MINLEVLESFTNYERYLLRHSLLCYIDRLDFMVRHCQFYSMNDIVKEDLKNDINLSKGLFLKLNSFESIIIENEKKEGNEEE